MASRARLSLPYPEATDPERPPPALTSDLLEEIFLRVASLADLVRASTACVSFRRLIADHAFLRRYRSIHPPLLLGLVRSYGLAPAEAPHTSAAVARAIAFSLDYLPGTTGWEDHWTTIGARDGRVLLERSSREVHNSWDLLVCDPLSRRYLLLPPITDDLLASIEIQNENIFHSGASFIHSGGIEEDKPFRVINWMQSSSRLGVFVFSSDSGCWSVSTSISWDDLGLDEILMFISEHCTTDCFYWKLEDMSTLVKLDMNSMRFCTIGLPPGHEERQIVIVESGESRVAMFSTIYEGTSVDYYTFSQNGCEKSHEWHLKSTIPLPAHYTCEGNIGGPAEGYIFIECIPDEPDTAYSTFFSLEIKSFNIERVGRTSSSATGVYPYFGFPPSMSPIMILDIQDSRCYVDASTPHDTTLSLPRRAGLGIYILNSQVQPIRKIHIQATMANSSSVLMAEAAALALGSSIIKAMNIPTCRYFSDCLQLVQFTNAADASNPPDWRILPFTKVFTNNATGRSFTTTHINRSQNSEADSLARQAYVSTDQILDFQCTHPLCTSLCAALQALLTVHVPDVHLVAVSCTL